MKLNPFKRNTPTNPPQGGLPSGYDNRLTDASSSAQAATYNGFPTYSGFPGAVWNPYSGNYEKPAGSPPHPQIPLAQPAMQEQVISHAAATGPASINPNGFNPIKPIEHAASAAGHAVGEVAHVLDQASGVHPGGMMLPTAPTGVKSIGSRNNTGGFGGTGSDVAGAVAAVPPTATASHNDTYIPVLSPQATPENITNTSVLTVPNVGPPPAANSVVTSGGDGGNNAFNPNRPLPPVSLGNFGSPPPSYGAFPTGGSPAPTYTAFPTAPIGGGSTPPSYTGFPGGPAPAGDVSTPTHTAYPPAPVGGPAAPSVPATPTTPPVTTTEPVASHPTLVNHRQIEIASVEEPRHGSGFDVAHPAAHTLKPKFTLPTASPHDLPMGGGFGGLDPSSGAHKYMGRH